MVDVAGAHIGVDYDKPKKIGSDNTVYPLRLKTPEEDAVTHANETENLVEGIGKPTSTIFSENSHILVGAGTLYEPYKHTWVSGMFYITQAALTTMCHYLVKHEGVCVGTYMQVILWIPIPIFIFPTGPSAGANMVGAYLAAKKHGAGQVVVSFLCDHGSRYASKTFNPKWCEEKGFDISKTDNLDFLAETLKINGL